MDLKRRTRLYVYPNIELAQIIANNHSTNVSIIQPITTGISKGFVDLNMINGWAKTTF